MEEILIGLLTKTLNKSPEDVRAILYKEGTTDLKDGVLDALLAEDAARVKGFNDKRVNDIEDQRKKAKKEAYQNLEGKLKTAFGLDTDKTGDDLIAEAKALQPDDGGGGNGEITDDQVKSHKLYIQLQTEKANRETELNTEWQTKLDEANQGHQAKATRQAVNDLALKTAKGLNPKFASEDPIKQANQLSVILTRFDGLEFEADGNGSYIVKKDGKAHVDEHNNPIAFDALVKNATTAYFELGDAAGGGGSGTGAGDGFGKGAHSTVTVPKDEAELKAAIRGAKTTEERVAISEAWEKSQAGDE